MKDIGKYKNLIIYSSVLALLFIGSILLLAPKIKNLIDLTKKVQDKTVQVTTLKAQLQQFESENQKEEQNNKLSIKKIFQPQLGSTPETAFTELFDSIFEFAKFDGIKIRAIEYEYNPQQNEVVKKGGSKLDVCILKLNLIADYSDFENFLRDLYKYPYLMSFSKIEITPYDRNKTILLINLELSLFASKN